LIKYYTVQLVIQDIQVQQEKRVILDLEVNRVCKVIQVNKEALVLKALKVQQEKRVILDLEVNREFRVPLENKVFKVRLDLKVKKGNRVKLDLEVNKALKEKRGILALTALKVQLISKV
jgi:hypothetical protein